MTASNLSLRSRPTASLLTGGFGLYWAARLLSLLGAQTSRTAIVLQIAANTSAAAAIGALIWCEILPGLAAGFFAGGIVDRVPRRTALVAADAVRAATLLIAAARPEFGYLLAAIALNSVATAFFNPARAAGLREIVRAEQLTEANAADQSASTGVLIAGPMLGALVFYNLGLRWALVADAVTFLLSAGLILAALPAARAAAAASESLGREIREGWSYLRRSPVPRTMLLLSAASVLSAGIWMPLAASFVRTFLKAGEGAIAQQLTLFGLGGLCGAPVAVWASRRAGRGRLFAAMLLAEAAAMLAYSRASNLAVSAFVVFLWGIAVSGIAVPFYSLLQDEAPVTHLGRIFAIHEQTENLGGAMAVVGPVLMQGLLPPQDIFAIAGLFYASTVAVLMRSRGGVLLFRRQ